MARYNLFLHIARTAEVNGGGYAPNSQVAFYVTCKNSGEHWACQEKNFSAEVGFVRVPGGEDKTRRVVMLSDFQEQDPTLSTLVVSAGGTDTWKGAGPRCTNMTRTALSIVQPGAFIETRRHDDPNVVKWHRCLGAYTFGAKSTRVQSLVVAEGPAPTPVREWRKATVEEIQAYQAWVNHINGRDCKEEDAA